jgi:glycogen debranching enzyme
VALAHRVNLRARGSQHFVYSGRCVLVTDLHGRFDDAVAKTGLFADNTRVISCEELTVDGRRPRPIVASPVGGDALLAYEAIHPNGADPGAGTSTSGVSLEISRFVGDGMRSILRFRNYSGQPKTLAVALRLEADFADTQEVEEGERKQEAGVESTWDPAAGELTIRYLHPRLMRAVAIRVVRAPTKARAEDSSLNFDVHLAARSVEAIEIAVEPIFDDRRWTITPRRSFAQAASPLERLSASLGSEMPRLATTNSTVSRAWDTATRDLASLPYGLPEGPATPSAGLPLYLQFFGRDSLTVGWQALMATPTLLRDSLFANAAWQGQKIDDWLDEEPGKMIHQARGGPLSVLGIDPFARYYGDWATPPDFMIMVGQYLAWTDDRRSVRRLLPALRAAIDWCDRYGDPDHDGFLEYDTRSPKGVKNQGWKDSNDAIVDEHGQIVPNPIATSELQAYWYAGLQQSALAFAATGDVGFSAELYSRARDLRRRFNEAFWMEDLGMYALGLGPDKRQIRSIGSNDGHLLASGIVPAARGRHVAARLMEPDLFSGWGIRTLSADHDAYDPFSYHRGSVWPVEQGTTAFGLARYGCWDELHRLAEGVFASTDLFVENRLPEVIGGIARDEEHPHPGIYPDSCEPQAWSASAIVMIVQALLGMIAVAPFRLLVVDPHLPPWLPDLAVEGIRVGRAQVDLEFRRGRDGQTTYRVTGRSGPIRVVRQPPPQSPGAHLPGRASAALRSLNRW